MSAAEKGQTMQRSELIAALEAATGPDRALDARICIALGLSKGNVMAGVDGWCINSETSPNPYNSPAYTASIDAALTLVPEGWLWSIDTLDDVAEACVAGPGPIPASSYVTAATPALAICLAATRAGGEG